MVSGHVIKDFPALTQREQSQIRQVRPGQGINLLFVNYKRDRSDLRTSSVNLCP